MKCNEEQWQNITDLCLNEKSGNPIEILCKLMDFKFCNMKGHEHHMMVSAALLTAYYNTVNTNHAGNNLENLERAFQKLETSDELNIGGDCDYWNACKIIGSVHTFWNIISDSKELGDMLLMEVANAVGSVCGPRCCKRSAYLAILKTVEFVNNHLEIEMKSEKFSCMYSKQNHACILEDCPFNEHYIIF